jgi:hypothetical protein
MRGPITPAGPVLDYTSLDEADLDLVRLAGRLPPNVGPMEETRWETAVNTRGPFRLEQFLAPGGEHGVLSGGVSDVACKK